MRLLVAAATDEGTAIPAGTEGTVVYVAPRGDTVMVEFAEPEGALVTVRASNVVKVGRSVP
ncbi:DUF4926 domain-containing protein [Methylobacterium oxalidis]|uniref:DUF4926 domain-containing protein n=1 Tax=Methylobacterium oxalidis TaxID=944322 RepID=UPI0033147F02